MDVQATGLSMVHRNMPRYYSAALLVAVGCGAGNLAHRVKCFGQLDQSINLDNSRQVLHSMSINMKCHVFYSLSINILCKALCLLYLHCDEYLIESLIYFSFILCFNHPSEEDEDYEQGGQT